MFDTLVSFIRKIKRNGRVYLAEVENRWVNGKVVQRHIRYVGREADCKTILAASLSEAEVEQVKLYGPLLVLHHSVDAGEQRSHSRRFGTEPLSPETRVSSSSRGCVKSGNPAFFAGFPSEVERSAFRLFHGASFPQPLRRPLRFSCCALPVIRIYGLVALVFRSSCSGSAPITLLSRMES